MSVPDSHEPPKQVGEGIKIPVENIPAGVVHVLGDGLSATLGAGKSVLGAGVSTILDLAKRDQRELPPGAVSVEPLANGIVGAVGDGVNAIVETSKSTGTYIASIMQDKAPALAVAGLVVFCEFAGEITDKLFGGKKNT